MTLNIFIYFFVAVISLQVLATKDLTLTRKILFNAAQGVQYTRIELGIPSFHLDLLSFRIFNEEATLYASEKLRRFLCNQGSSYPCLMLFLDEKELIMSANKDFERPEITVQMEKFFNIVHGKFFGQLSVYYCCSLEFCVKIANFYSLNSVFNADIYYEPGYIINHTVNYRRMCYSTKKKETDTFPVFDLVSNGIYKVPKKKAQFIKIRIDEYVDLEFCFQHLHSTSIATYPTDPPKNTLMEYYYTCTSEIALLYHYPAEYSSNSMFLDTSKPITSPIIFEENMSWITFESNGGELLFINMISCYGFFITYNGKKIHQQKANRWQNSKAGDISFVFMGRGVAVDLIENFKFKKAAYCFRNLHHEPSQYFKKSLTQKSANAEKPVVDIGDLLHIMPGDKKGMKFTVPESHDKFAVLGWHNSGKFIVIINNDFSLAYDIEKSIGIPEFFGILQKEMPNNVTIYTFVVNKKIFAAVHTFEGRHTFAYSVVINKPEQRRKVNVELIEFE